MSPIEQNPTSVPDYRMVYCAGYFDGEGCIWVGTQKRRSYYLRLNVASGDYDTLRIFGELFGGEVKPVKAKSSNKNIFHWSKNSCEAVETLSKLLPFMTAKREEAQLVVDFGWEPVQPGKRLSDEQIAKRCALRQALQKAKEKGLKTSHETRQVLQKAKERGLEISH